MVLFPSNEFNETCVCILQYIENQFLYINDNIGIMYMFFSCSSDFSAKRITRPGKFGRVIIAAKDGGSMLRTELWNQVLYLDQVCF